MGRYEIEMCIRDSIQHQNFRIGKQGTRKGDQLLLALGKSGTPFVDLRVIPVFHFTDKLMGTYGFGRRDNLLVRGVQPAVPDVIHNGSGENEAVLQHDAHLRTQGMQRHSGNVVPCLLYTSRCV